MKRTYRIIGYNGIPTQKYKEYLAKLGFIENERSIGLLLCFQGEGVFDRTTRSYCKSAIDNVSNICNKGQLRKTLGEFGEKYMAKEYRWSDVALNMHLKVDKVIIVKPISGFGGKGIKIYKKGDLMSIIGADSYVFCEYVTDLLLFKGRKFHLRVYLFATTWGVFRRYPEYRIITAKSDFVLDNWDREDIHDTHLKWTDADYFFRPDGDLYIEKTDKQITEVCDEIIRHLNPKPYKESTAAYEMLGLDFLVKSDGDVVLLEVNTNAGIKCVDEWNTYKEGVLAMEMDIIDSFFPKARLFKK